MEKKILLIGGGGHCKSVLDSLLSLGEYDEIGVVDNNPGACVPGAYYAGNDDDLPRLFKEGWKYAFVTVGSVGSTALRRRLSDMVHDIGFINPAIIDPTSAVARGSVIEDGVYVGKKAIINTGSIIKKCSIINTAAVIEHDCTVGEFSHISPGAVVCGNTSVGNDVHVGAGAVVIQGISIGDDVMIGAGSIVVKSLVAGVKAYGNPCRVVD